MHQALAKNVVISGFHSPLEQLVLKVLTQARSPVVVVLARPVNGAKLPPDWAEPVTAATKAARLTGEAATARNNLVAQLATRIVVAHASPGGVLASLVAQWQLVGQRSLKVLG